MSSRPLTLHVSALNHDEYSVYTDAFNDLVDCGQPSTIADWDSRTVGLRDARGWMRGRYASLNGSVIDKILRWFHPELAPTDVLTGGQWFAAMRLLTHAQADPAKEIQPDLVFVQPAPMIAARVSTLPTSAAKAPPPPIPLEPPPRHKSRPPTPSRTRQLSAEPLPIVEHPLTLPFNNPFHRSPSAPATARPTPPPSSVSGSAVSSDESSLSPSRPHPPPPPPRSTSSASSNPFLRSKSLPSAPLSAPSSPPLPANVDSLPTLPPLPPRKTPLLPPPRHASIVTPPGVHNTNMATSKPPKPPPATSQLIKQSLLAAKGAQTGIDKLRTWEVIRSSAGTSGVTSGIGGVWEREQRDRDRDRHGHSYGSVKAPSAASTSSSLEQIASAQLPTPVSELRHSRSSSSAVDPLTNTVDLATPPREKTEDSPTTRLSRSRSLHHESSPPVPPPRRRRPESVQISPSPSLNDTSASPFFDGFSPNSSSSLSNSPTPIARHQSAAAHSDVGHDHERLHSLQRTLNSLTLKAKPGLENARMKMEGKLVPGGYTKWGGARDGGGDKLVARPGVDSDDDDGSHPNSTYREPGWSPL